MKEILKNFIKQYLVLYLVLFLLFFVVVYLILFFKMFSIESYIMPSLVGKYYIDVHNEVSKYQLNVELRKVYIQEKPEGIILQQNIMPGENIKPKDKLVLVVNSYEALLTMPHVEELTLNNAMEVLSTIPYDEDVYQLEVAKILYVYTEDKSDNIVLYQYPAPGTKVKINTKVFLIVSSKEQTETVPLEELKKLDLGIVSQYLVLKQIPYLVKEIITPKTSKENGRIHEIRVVNDIYEVEVYYRKKKHSFFSDYELVSFRFPREETCDLYHSPQSLENIEDIERTRKIWFSRPNIFRERKLDLLFYRSGNSHLYLICNEKIVWKKVKKPDYSI
ncbi:MAG: PASTA domain-containing protein [Leptospiraceae bacterium]|nr:PASTA domain-containing protein [Leptospiraceae bacterium]MDW7975404.1 PASTA domain-containing protein [Leptospiraceae bacterium]